MSMNATFVQVDEAELSRLQADPSLVETLFGHDGSIPPALIALTKTMQDRLRAAGPQMPAGALSRLDPALRRQLEESLGRTTAALAADPDAILKLMQGRKTRGAGPASSVNARAVLSLDKAWHGVHYVLCGQAEPGAALLSQAVLGGTELGDDDEGFSGYGPPRYFTTAQVVAIGQAFSRPELESDAAARFDAERMNAAPHLSRLGTSDAEWVMDGFRRLRDFYSDAAGKGRAIITCLV